MTVWVLFFYLGSSGMPSPSLFAHTTLAECEHAAKDYRKGAYACVKVDVPKRSEK
jgi:hypothetical protein